MIVTPTNQKTSTANPIGYGSGAGSTVTQLTSRTTGVTINKPTGQITTNNTSLAALAAASFTVTNSAVGANDVVVAAIKSGAVNKKTQVEITAIAAGSFELTVYNADAATAETGAIVVQFAVIKGAIA
jgi:hypothetical protein